MKYKIYLTGEGSFCERVARGIERQQIRSVKVDNALQKLREDMFDLHAVEMEKQGCIHCVVIDTDAYQISFVVIGERGSAS